MTINAVDDRGHAVDWWFMYKVSAKSTTGDGGRGALIGGKPVTGTEYLYFDANAPATGKLAMSAQRVDRGGALKATLQQLSRAGNDSLGWFFYNDEDPVTGRINSSRGHTKGVLAFDLKSDSAFWLIQSTPKFPPKGTYAFPTSGMKEAQTLLCITLKDAGTAQSIAKQMLVAQQPHVYLASAVPKALSGNPNDPRARLMRDQVAAGTTPVHMVLPFRSRGGKKFMAIAKNKAWRLDFYNDLVGPSLSENLEVETWEHDPLPPAKDSDKTHDVVAMKEVRLTALGIDLAWTDDVDHGKLAISAPTERVHWVCVGDINFTVAQRKRGGGTVAFQHPALWKSLTSILTQTVTPAKKTAAKKTAGGARSRAVRR